jgi:hypothetical protein
MFRNLGKNCTLLSLDMVSFFLYTGDTLLGVFDSPEQALAFVNNFVK